LIRPCSMRWSSMSGKRTSAAWFGYRITSTAPSSSPPPWMPFVMSWRQHTNSWIEGVSMSESNRETILNKLRDKIRKGQPIVGGGAGTGLSAKCEEAGGIDLIVIYNSGRYRMAGRGSLAGLLAYG